jgi:hypothetical protein
MSYDLTEADTFGRGRWRFQRIEAAEFAEL